MRNLMKYFLLCMLLLTAMSCTRVPSGHVGIKVYLLGSEKGVDQEVLGVGRYWIGYNEELHLFPTFVQNVVWTADSREGSPHDESITFQTQEGLALSGNFGFSYKLIAEKIPTLFQEHRKGIEEITDVYVRNAVRKALNEAASTRKVEDIYGPGKKAFLEEAINSIKSELGPQGFEIVQFAPIGKFVLPANVVKALNAKIEATQRAQMRENELREAEAEAAKKLAHSEGKAKAILMEAEAQAKANKILAASLTDELVEYKTIERWNGQLSQVSGNTTPIIKLGN